MRKIDLLRLSILLTLALITPSTVYAIPTAGNTDDQNQECYTVATSSNGLPDTLAESKMIDEIMEETIEDLPIVSIFQETQQKTFLDYFPDPNFALLVARAVRKEASDYTSLEELKTITFLDWTNSGIRDITNVGLLSNLEWLTLNYSDLTFLPEDIGQLSKLKRFEIWGKQNSFQSLPESFGNLIQL